ncbi:unnamed protein product [Lepeophtheirus salmonis]|uniref:(salmon louse) hypothetical protein n=1 Tax=Lepeophtheirus salmonis TaxID=72036 RepID=A0A7R8H8R7_LEPSM|nr:unnamed protein product [Lepeophtheirus salmonis]CAF2935695.1 unnamed protein product [Lepeophtheirus salmonis]
MWYFKIEHNSAFSSPEFPRPRQAQFFSTLLEATPGSVVGVISPPYEGELKVWLANKVFFSLATVRRNNLPNCKLQAEKDMKSCGKCFFLPRWFQASMVSIYLAYNGSKV